MKKVLLALFVFMLIPIVCQAAPFLRCDRYTVTMGDPDYFKVVVDSGTYIQSPTYVYPGETGDSLHYDLASLPAGQHTIKVQACNAANPPWSLEVCSADSAPFTFTKPVPAVAPSAPVSLGLSAQ